jgi:hypothetical protein
MRKFRNGQHVPRISRRRSRSLPFSTTPSPFFVRLVPRHRCRHAEMGHGEHRAADMTLFRCKIAQNGLVRDSPHRKNLAIPADSRSSHETLSSESVKVSWSCNAIQYSLDILRIVAGT